MKIGRYKERKVKGDGTRSQLQIKERFLVITIYEERRTGAKAETVEHSYASLEKCLESHPKNGRLYMQPDQYLAYG